MYFRECAESGNFGEHVNLTNVGLKVSAGNRRGRA
jgi:hypothetical protein